ncbi:MAG: hypothetical protein XD98_0565 [Microgenomates bacterium 39_6]|nr:MAG: hypothetical protein XD98_0565 [Microgenomates bacterium 39_6]
MSCFFLNQENKEKIIRTVKKSAKFLKEKLLALTSCGIRVYRQLLKNNPRVFYPFTVIVIFWLLTMIASMLNFYQEVFLYTGLAIIFLIIFYWLIVGIVIINLFIIALLAKCEDIVVQAIEFIFSVRFESFKFKKGKPQLTLIVKNKYWQKYHQEK